MDEILFSAERTNKWITPIFDVGRSMFDVRRSVFLVFSALVFLAGSAACGKKAMPVPPKSDPVPAVSDLSHEIHGGYVHLAWTLPGPVADGRFGRGEAVVSRARTRLGDGGCDDCPLVFQQVAVQTVSSGKGMVDQTHREVLATGFQYTFRIVLQMGRGRTSAPSNLVQFDYELE